MRKIGANGFTLIEAMITVVIIAILAAVGYPSYISFVTEARRSDATIPLTQLAAQQEKFFTQCGGYADTIGAARVCPAVPGGAGGVINANTVSLNPGGITREGNYQVTIAPDLGGIANSFILTATPLGLQLTRDGAKCTTIGLNSTGVKLATGSDSGKCWKK